MPKAKYSHSSSIDQSGTRAPIDDEARELLGDFMARLANNEPVDFIVIARFPGPPGMRQHIDIHSGNVMMLMELALLASASVARQMCDVQRLPEPAEEPKS